MKTLIRLINKDTIFLNYSHKRYSIWYKEVAENIYPFYRLYLNRVNGLNTLEVIYDTLTRPERSVLNGKELCLGQIECDDNEAVVVIDKAYIKDPLEADQLIYFNMETQTLTHEKQEVVLGYLYTKRFPIFQLEKGDFLCTYKFPLPCEFLLDVIKTPIDGLTFSSHEPSKEPFYVYYIKEGEYTGSWVYWYEPINHPYFEIVGYLGQKPRLFSIESSDFTFIDNSEQRGEQLYLDMNQRQFSTVALNDQAHCIGEIRIL